jgi:hypothetical protein
VLEFNSMMLWIRNGSGNLTRNSKKSIGKPLVLREGSPEIREVLNDVSRDDPNARCL